MTDDSYVQAVAFLLFLFGIIGLIWPAWFLRLSRFPFIRREQWQTPVNESERSRARIWAVLSLIGALALASGLFS